MPTLVIVGGGRLRRNVEIFRFKFLSFMKYKKKKMILVQPEWVFLPDALQMDYYGTFSDPHVRENQLDKSEEQS